MINKKGLIGKIFLIIFLAVMIVVAITAYQIFDLITTIESQQGQIQSEITQLQNGDCSKITSIETRAIILESKANSACANPLIYYASLKYQQLPYSCADISLLKNEAEEGLKTAKNYCDIKTLNNFTEQKIKEYLENLTRNNYLEYAQKFNLDVSNQSEEQAIQTVKVYLSTQANVTQ